ncbi:TPA: recombinase family protein [Haemophilus influenzae]|uniref:recombinase family protein n=1 Tax=Haemophilus influenzae TaxID=727 RepID=UPI000E353535|nr:recombinase family protein [Haemophilus influenzae]RFN77083.1 recombinase family protein [Haemophilus influenzae]
MAKIGYARVSTTKQDLSEQITALKKFGCEKIFSGKFSGKDEDLETILTRVKQNKVQLDKMLNYVREGDIVVVTKIDRLGRSLIQCLKTLDYFKQNKIGFVALDQGIDTTKRKDPMAMAMIHLLGLFAELERNFIVERTQGGKLAKVESGDLKAIGGRPKKLSEKAEEKLVKDILKGGSINELAKKYEVSRATISRYKKRVK